MRNKLILVAMLMLTLIVTAGCGGGGSDAQRQSGLSPEQVVQSFFDAAKGGRMKEAALYVSPTSANDTKTVLKYVTGESRSTVKNSNLLSVKKLAQQGNYTAVVATLQAEQNSANLSIKPVGLEKIDGEWYIVDYDQAISEAKYKVLAQLLNRI